MGRGIRAGLLALCLPWLYGAAADAGWTQVRPEAGGFTARFPGEPRRSEYGQRTFAGRVASVEYSWVRDDLDLRVEHHDLPALADWFLSDEALLARAEDDLLADERGTRVARRAWRPDGRPGLELRYRIEDGGWEGRARLVLAGRRLYIAVALVRGEGGAEDDAARFLDSFRVLPGTP